MSMSNGLLTIIEIAAHEDGRHGLVGQAGKAECWLEGWIEVPDELENTAWTCHGYCDLDIQDGVLVGITPKPIPKPVPTKEQQIAALKAELSATDYQIIKCGEYQLAGRELPYDIAKLHAQRQELRDRINELEGKDDETAEVVGESV